MWSGPRAAETRAADGERFSDARCGQVSAAASRRSGKDASAFTGRPGGADRPMSSSSPSPSAPEAATQAAHVARHASNLLPPRRTVASPNSGPTLTPPANPRRSLPPPFPSPQAAAPAVSARAPAALAAAAALLLSAQPARADLVSDLVAKSEANKELNDAKRLATSGANFARANTVAYGSCAFPYNFLGCENLAEAGKVKFISDDLALECKGQTTCTAKPKVALPSFMGV